MLLVLCFAWMFCVLTIFLYLVETQLFRECGIAIRWFGGRSVCAGMFLFGCCGCAGVGAPYCCAEICVLCCFLITSVTL